MQSGGPDPRGGCSPQQLPRWQRYPGRSPFQLHLNSISELMEMSLEIKYRSFVFRLVENGTSLRYIFRTPRIVGNKPLCIYGAF